MKRIVTIHGEKVTDYDGFFGVFEGMGGERQIHIIKPGSSAPEMGTILPREQQFRTDWRAYMASQGLKLYSSCATGVYEEDGGTISDQLPTCLLYAKSIEDAEAIMMRHIQGYTKWIPPGSTINPNIHEEM